MPTLIRPGTDLREIEALDFAPVFSCEDSDHDQGGPAPAVWRVRKKHSTAGCEAEAEVLLCNDHLIALQRLSNVIVICVHCGHGAYGREWWRLAGGI